MLISGINPYIMSISPFISLTAVIGAWILFKTLRVATQPFRSPLRFVNGPSDTFLMFETVMRLKGFDIFSKWREQYGHVYAIRAAFGVSLPFVSLLPLLT
jgi:hypothetical protein